MATLPGSNCASAPLPFDERAPTPFSTNFAGSPSSQRAAMRDLLDSAI